MNNIYTKFGLAFFLKILTYLLAPLSLIFIVKELSVSQYGLYNLINTTVAIGAIIFGLGIHRYNFKEIPGKSIDDQYSIFKSNLLLVSSFSFIILFIIFLFAFFFNKGDLSFLIIIFLFTFFNIFNNELLRFFGLRKKINIKSLFSFLNQKGWLLIIGVLYIFNKINLLNIYLSKLIVMILVSIFLFLKLNKNKFINIKSDNKIIYKSIRFGLPLIFADLGIYLLESGDRYIINLFYTNVEVGLYSFAYNWIKIVYSLGTVFMYVMQPYIAENYNKEKDDNFDFTRKTMSITLKFTLVILMGGLVFFTVNFDKLVLLLAKETYLDTRNIIFILILFPIVMSLSYFIHQIMILQDKNKTLVNIFLIATIFNIGLNFILVPAFNIEGAAISTVISYIILFILSLIKVDDLKLLFEFKIIKVINIIIFSLIFAVLNIIFNIYITNIYYILTLNLIFGIVLLFILKIITKEDILILNKLK